MPLDSTSKTAYEEKAGAAWVLGPDGLPIRVFDVAGTVEVSNLQAAETDGATGAAVGIDAVHHEIHEGETWIVSYKTPDASPIADNGTIIFAFTIGNRYVHVSGRAAFGGDAEAELLENPTWTGGTVMTPRNKNRAKLEMASTVTVVRDPTISADGLTLEDEFVPGGSGPQAVGGVAAQRAEWILKPGFRYAMRITNRAGTNQPGSLAAEWYEETSNG